MSSRRSITERRALPHFGALLLFAGFAAVWTYPLARHLGTSLPGEHIGDNGLFLWDFWWMRAALARPDLNFFTTSYLFAPLGVDLTLHTHFALESWIGATLLGRLGVVPALNVIILASLTLNGFCAYALAFDRVHRNGPALLAGLIYAGSAYFSAHLLGHFNLVAGWGLPLFVLCWLRALEGNRRPAAIASGLVLAGIAYSDYYYFIYAGGIALCLLLVVTAPVTWTIGPPGRTRARFALVLLLVVVAVAGAFIAVTGGGVWRIGAVSIRATGTRNLVTLAWLLAAATAWLTWPPEFSMSRGGIRRLRAALAPGAIAAATAMLLIAPVIVQGVRVLTAGDYTTPVHYWRSSAPGIDLAALVVPSPRQRLWGTVATSAFQRLRLDPIEGVGWLGIIPVALTLLAVRVRTTDRERTLWMSTGLVFFVWALGPWLQAGGANLGLPLPQGVLSLLPILGNARMPGRGLVVVSLATALLSAWYLTSHRPLRTPMLAALALFISLDFLPAPFPIVTIAASPLDVYLRGLPAGTVCPIPFGVSDGLGETGRHDSRETVSQITHEHPIVGGLISRAPERVVRSYREMPVLRTVLQLSTPGETEAIDAALSSRQAADALAAAGVRYVIVNPQTSSPALLAYVHEHLPLSLLHVDGERELYVVREVETDR